MGYKLEWKNPNDASAPTLTMMYTSDTRPEQNSIDQASNGGNGVDVFIHEMVVPPSVWAFKPMGLKAPPEDDSPYYPTYLYAINMTETVQASSHTPQGAFGYLLSKISPRPRLTVATHFPVADDTVACAYNSVLAHCNDIGKLGEQVTWSFDLMVISVTSAEIKQMKAVVNNYGWAPGFPRPSDMNTPRYWMYELDEEGKIKLGPEGNPIKTADPYAQIDYESVIPATEENGTVNYRTDGY